MITLALDPSTKSTGWAIFDNQSLIKSGCITASSPNLYSRIDKMIKEISALFLTYQITNVAIEDVIPEDVRHNQTIFKALIYLQGFILHEINNHSSVKTIKFYTTSEWRKLCGIHTGRGVKRESLKPADKAFVKNQFNVSVNDDEADAICIGFAFVGGEIKEPQVIIKDDFEFA